MLSPWLVVLLLLLLFSTILVVYCVCSTICCGISETIVGLGLFAKDVSPLFPKKVLASAVRLNSNGVVGVGIFISFAILDSILESIFFISSIGSEFGCLPLLQLIFSSLYI